MRFILRCLVVVLCMHVAGTARSDELQRCGEARNLVGKFDCLEHYFSRRPDDFRLIQSDTWLFGGHWATFFTPNRRAARSELKIKTGYYSRDHYLNKPGLLFAVFYCSAGQQRFFASVTGKRLKLTGGLSDVKIFLSNGAVYHRRLPSNDGEQVMVADITSDIELFRDVIKSDYLEMEIDTAESGPMTVRVDSKWLKYSILPLRYACRW